MKSYVSEFIGTFAIVFFGTGAIIVNQQTQGMISHAGIALAFGFTVMVMIYALGQVSGAHFNPAVTVAFAFAGTFSYRQVIPYLLSQVAGALSASALLKLLFPDNHLLGTTLPSGTAMQSFILEAIMTFFLMLVILQVAHGSKEIGLFAGLAIGSVVLIEALFAGPVSGASMNPARSLAPALWSGHLEYLWIYITAPFIGAIAAVGIWKYLKS